MRQLLLGGELINAKRALEIGMVNRVVPAEEVMNEALTFARHDKGDGPTIQRTCETVRSRLLGGRSCGCMNSEVLDLLFEFVNKVGSAGAVYHPMIEG